jgi:hypothetical protein
MLSLSGNSWKQSDISLISTVSLSSVNDDDAVRDVPQPYREQASRLLEKYKVRSRIAELQAQVVSQSVIAAALTLDAHMEMLSELRDKADQRGQTSAAIRAEELRGQLMRFYVKQVETGDAGDFSRMSDEELCAYVNGEKLPPKGETKH